MRRNQHSEGAHPSPLILHPFLVLLITVALLAYFFITQQRITNGVIGVPLDDAWIHYQFAKNISLGNGFSYNPGVPTPGSTAPLWTVILAGVGLFTQDFIIPSLMLSAGFLLLAVWLTYTLLKTLEFPPFVSFLGALGTALSGRLLWAGLSGMEVTLFICLCLGAILLYHKRGLDWITAVILALASQVRPEAHLLFLIIIADSVLFNRSKKAWRNVIVAGAIYALINAPYALLSLSVTGKPLANTFYAKADSSQFFSVRTLRELLRMHFYDNQMLFVLVPFGLWPLFKKSRVTAVWLLGLFLATPIVVSFLWHHGRYTMPLIPFFMLTGAVGANEFANFLKSKFNFDKRPFIPHPSSFILILALLLGGLRLPIWSSMLGTNTQEILDIDVAIGEWLHANTEPDALIAVDDIGAIGFLSERTLYDTLGLVSPEVWPAITGYDEGHPRNVAMTRLMSQAQPDYLAIFPQWHYEIGINDLLLEEAATFTTSTHTMIGVPEAKIFKVKQWPFLAEATPETATELAFANNINLLGFDIAVTDSISLTLYWESITQLADQHDVFIHIVNDAGDIVAQADGVPFNWLLPTHMWEAGDIIRDPYTIPLPDDLAAGDYQIRLGLFSRATGARLPISGDLPIEADSVLLTTID